MHVFQIILMIIAMISGVALVVAVAFQTSTDQSFSAAMGGGGADPSKFRKGSKEEMLDRLTKYSAIVWIVSCAIYAVMHYAVK